MEPWGYQSYLKKEKIPNTNEVIVIAREIESDRDRALFIIAYLTAGRICELVQSRNQGIPKASIRKTDLQMTERENRRVLLITIRNEKNKHKPTKDIPILLDKPENIKLFNLLIPYLNSLEMNDELFPFGRQRAYKIIKKIGFNPHFIRHIRLTHLTTIYNFNEQELKMYAGWTDSRPSKFYVELRWGDLLSKL